MEAETLPEFSLVQSARTAPPSPPPPVSFAPNAPAESATDTALSIPALDIFLFFNRAWFSPISAPSSSAVALPIDFSIFFHKVSNSWHISLRASSLASLGPPIIPNFYSNISSIADVPCFFPLKVSIRSRVEPEGSEKSAGLELNAGGEKERLNTSGQPKLTVLASIPEALPQWAMRSPA